MFGLIVAGRLVQTEFQQVDATHVVFSLDNADSINHVIVFLTGQIRFPDNFAGAVYFSMPNTNGNESGGWQYLGFISNDKPSAIFRIAKLKQRDDTELPSTNQPFSFLHPNSSVFGVNQPHIAQIGISVEPLETINGLTAAAGVNASKVENVVEFTKNMLENFFNYASSFAVNANSVLLKPSENYVPMNVVQHWYENFQRRLNVNPMFWKN